jgi:hypothetical protein
MELGRLFTDVIVNLCLTYHGSREPLPAQPELTLENKPNRTRQRGLTWNKVLGHKSILLSPSDENSRMSVRFNNELGATLDATPAASTSASPTPPSTSSSSSSSLVYAPSASPSETPATATISTSETTTTTACKPKPSLLKTWMQLFNKQVTADTKQKQDFHDEYSIQKTDIKIMIFL